MDQMTLGDNLLGQVSTQAIASVMEELDKEASALTEKIQGLIRENNGSLVISKDQARPGISELPGDVGGQCRFAR